MGVVHPQRLSASKEAGRVNLQMLSTIREKRHEYNMWKMGPRGSDNGESHGIH